MIENIISGAVGGLLVLFIQWTYDYLTKKRISKEKLIIGSKYSGKLIDSSILRYLSPAKSLKKSFEILGTESAYCESEFSHFTEEYFTTNSYLFILKNGAIKLTSENNKVIDTITILTDFENSNFNFGSNNIINESILEYSTNHFSFNSSKELYFGVETYYGAVGRYLNISYFGTDHSKIRDHEEGSLEKLKGAKIEQICLSRISEFAPYICNGELQTF